MKTPQSIFRLSPWDARCGKSLELSRSKTLVGADSRCDLVLEMKGISPDHCYLVVDGEGVRVIDLASTNGTYVNGRRIKEALLMPGDTLTLADLAFQLEVLSHTTELVNCEAAVTALASVTSIPAAVEVPERAGLVLIDQEYCDLELKVSEDQLLHGTTFQVNEASGEELESFEAPLDLLEDNAQKLVEVVTYTSGQVLDVAYVDMEKHGLILSPILAADKIWFPGIQTEINLLERQGLNWAIRCPEGFSLSGSAELGSAHVFLTSGVHQLSLRMVEKSYRVRPLPFLWRDRAFYREAGKIAGAVFLPFLLLLLISFPEKKPDETKQITIIYKSLKQTDGDAPQELAATEVTSQNENTGTKATEQPKTKPQMAKAAAAAAAAPASAEPVAAAAAKPKAYSFKSSVSLDSVVADPSASGAGASTGRKAASVGGKGFGASAGALNGTASGTGVSVGTLGSDASGTASTSAGAKGLVSKKGFDHSYLEPKTVVLGSMDPELLRKILQEYLPQFRHCYQQELVKAASEIKGVIDLDFQISAEGRVSRTDVRAKDARFTNRGMDCMASVLKIIEFPKPKGGGVVDVRQPLNFFAETEKI